MKKNGFTSLHVYCIYAVYICVTLFSFSLGATPINALKVTATPTAETCNGNGSATITIDHTEAGAELQIVLFKKPDLTNPAPGSGIRNTTATGSQVSEVFNGLAAGDYTVKVTQSVETTPGNTETNETTTDFTVGSNSQPIPLMNVLEEKSCNGAKLTVTFADETPTTDYTFQLKNEATGIVEKTQTGVDPVVFDDVALGECVIIAINSCGDQRPQSFTVTTERHKVELPSMTALFREDPVTTCGTRIFTSARLGSMYRPTAYPAVFKVTAKVDGKTTVHEFTLVDKNSSFRAELPASTTGSKDEYRVELTDACGRTDSDTYTSTLRKSLSYRVSSDGACGEGIQLWAQYYITYPITITFTEYPTGFEPADYATLPGFTSGSYTATFNSPQEVPYFGLPDSKGEDKPGLPEGDYVIETTDACGEFFRVTKTVNTPSFSIFVRGEGHDLDGLSSIDIYSRTSDYRAIPLVSAKIISAPPAYTGPIDVSSNIRETDLRIRDLPIGEYTFELVNSCGYTKTITKTLTSFTTDNFTYNIVRSCGSFRVDYNFNYEKEPLIQPHTLSIRASGQLEGSPGVGGGTFEGSILNATVEGDLNLVLRYGVYDPDEAFFNKEVVLDSFTFYHFKFNDYYVFECPGGKVNLALDADGVEPFNYTITSKDGDTSFTKDNGSNPVFTDLDPGMYSVKVEDSCGNIVNVTLDARSSKFPTIKPNNLCHDENGYLYLPGLDFLNIEWFKDGNPVSGITGIIQDQNYLRFETFDNALHQGTYTARLTYANAASCIDETLSFTVGDTSKPPRAGEDNEIEIELDDLGLSIDLFDYLADGTYDLHGTWEELTDSKLLVSNTWMAEHAKVGTYQFKYTVEGLCHSGTAESIITLNVLSSVCTQLPTTGTPKPSHVGITTLGRKDQNTSWVTGVNNGYLVLESKEKGFVITRTTASSINDAREGMIIWDTADQCVKLYNGSDWKCIEPSCNE